MPGTNVSQALPSGSVCMLEYTSRTQPSQQQLWLSLHLLLAGTFKFSRGDSLGLSNVFPGHTHSSKPVCGFLFHSLRNLSQA